MVQGLVRWFSVLAGGLLVVVHGVRATDCPDAPYSSPTCPCVGPPVSDGMVLNGGVWCFNGGDDTLSNVILQNGAVLIVCDDVTLYNVSVNNGSTLVIGSGVSVVVGGSGTWSVNGTIVNYGSLTLTVPTNIASGGAFFNGGYVQALEPLTINSLSGYVGLPGSQMTGAQITVTVLAQCGICLHDASVQVGCLTNGGATPSVCVDTGAQAPGCLQIDSCVNLTGQLSGDTVYVCGEGAAQVDSQYLGNAIVDTSCECAVPFLSGPVLRLLVRGEGLGWWLTWEWLVVPEVAVAFYRVWRYAVSGSGVVDSEGDLPWEVCAQTDQVEFLDDARCLQGCFYRVEAWLANGQSVYSNVVYVRGWGRWFVWVVGERLVPDLMCLSSGCRIRVWSVDGREVGEISLHEGLALSAVFPRVAQGVYLVEVLAGWMGAERREDAVGKSLYVE